MVKVSERATSSQLNRYNRMRSVTIEANLADGYSLGEALSYLEGVVDKKLQKMFLLITKVSRNFIRRVAIDSICLWARINYYLLGTCGAV